MQDKVSCNLFHDEGVPSVTCTSATRGNCYCNLHPTLTIALRVKLQNIIMLHTVTFLAIRLLGKPYCELPGK